MTALALVEGVERRPLGLDIPKGQTFDEWVAMGRSLCDGQRVINWWLGDWWAAGSHRYGERAKAAAEGIFGREFQTLMDMASVCRAFATSRRREALTFTHHREAAALPPGEADALLTRAETDRLSTREVRVEAIKRRTALGLFVPKAPAHDGDTEYADVVAITQRWNRLDLGARETFLDLLQEVGMVERVDGANLAQVLRA